MAEEEQPSNPPPPSPSSHHNLPPNFIEVMCKSSGRRRRFAAGTEARFAVYLINKKLDNGVPLALHIEAVKEGEEPVSFGPSAVLVDYGDGWKLETVTEIEFAGSGKKKRVQTTEVKIPGDFLAAALGGIRAAFNPNMMARNNGPESDHVHDGVQDMETL